MNKKIGSYILFINLKFDAKIDIGKLGKISFCKGHYIYVGSALNGLDIRIQRHLVKEKKLHWHIDYLLTKADAIQVFYRLGNKKEECNIANVLKENLSSIDGFGCSDCECKSHLFYGPYENIIKSISKLNMRKYFNEKY
jgi:Uri superfamily endonuclease